MHESSIRTSVKLQRINRNLLIKEVAIPLHISCNHLGKIEKGKRNLNFRLALRLARFYGCSIPDLYKPVLDDF